MSNSPAPFLSDPFTAPTPPAQPQYATFPFEATPGGPALTPDAPSQSSSSATATAAGAATGTGEGEKDPFLSLLEQLAENEHSQGGPSELDFFLGEGLDMVLPEVEVENP